MSAIAKLSPVLEAALEYVLIELERAIEDKGMRSFDKGALDLRIDAEKVFAFGVTRRSLDSLAAKGKIVLSTVPAQFHDAGKLNIQVVSRA